MPSGRPAAAAAMVGGDDGGNGDSGRRKIALSSLFPAPWWAHGSRRQFQVPASLRVAAAAAGGGLLFLSPPPLR